MNTLAERYVKLVLATGVHEPGYVDAYYGPPEWKQEVERQKLPLAGIREQANVLAGLITGMPSAGDELDQLRQQYLAVQTRSMAKRVEILEGKRFSFDEESRALFDAVAPIIPEERFEATLTELGTMLPGKGNLVDRHGAWEKGFVVPVDKVSAIFAAAVNAARQETKKRIALPAHESFDTELVKGQPWSAYNWYKGKAHSLIQVNTDLPFQVGAAAGLAAHEGYPGHHVYNALLEDKLVVQRKWLEFTVYPLYSPQSLIAEGSAEYGVDLVFPAEDRTVLLEKTLFPLAGLDGAKARAYQTVRDKIDDLSHARNQAARAYLDGQMNKPAALEWLTRYSLQTPERAAKSLQFIEKHRSYVINYNLGKDLIQQYMEKRGAPLSNPAKAWSEFSALLSSPRLPSGLS